MGRLDLALLGGWVARVDGRAVVGFKSAKARALLAYLAVEAGLPHRREALAALFWPEHPESGARANLSQALFNLRSILGDRGAASSLPADSSPAGPALPFLLVQGEAIQFNAASDHGVDVAVLAAAVRACAEHGHAAGDECDACLERLHEAAELYRGAFLQDLAIEDSAAFEEWAAVQRERLHRLALEALQRLAAAHERRGDYERGLAYAWRQVELDPWREEGQRQLMRLLALAGQRSAALAQYEACRRALAEELGAEPATETIALYEAIRQGAPIASPYATMEPIHRSSFAADPVLRVPQSPLPRVSHLPLPESPPLPFVAREPELAHLDGWLQEALAGQGRMGFVVGEPGSGKTALLRELTRQAMEAYPELIVAGGSCNAYVGLGDSYLPFVEIMRLLTGDVEPLRAAGDLSDEHARRLREATPFALQAVTQNGPALIDALLSRTPLLERAKALPDGTRWAMRVQEAANHRPALSSPGLLHDQVSQVLQAIARTRPLLLILDDLQWADKASIDLLFHLGRRLAGRRLLILGAYRPEEVAVGRGGVVHPLAGVLCELQVLWEDLTVDLAQTEGRAFVDALVDREPNRLGVSFHEALYRRTGGHALFTIELLRGLKQRGDLARDESGLWVQRPDLDWDILPKRVEAVIAAQIARLPHAVQELLSVASIEGEEFHAEVAARVLGRSEGEVVTTLSGALSQAYGLVRAQSVQHLGGQRFSRYRFRHYLFQHYLYERMDATRRSHGHGEVASALEALGAAPVARDLRDTQSVMEDDRSDIFKGPEWIVSEATMAWHWQEAGLAERAAAYHIHAGRRACYLSLHYEQVRLHFVRALELLATLPTTPRRLRWEQACYHLVAWTWAMAKSWMAPEAGQAWRKSVERAEQIGDPLLVADALTFLSLYHRNSGELGLAISLGERAVTLAQGGLPGWVHWVEGNLAYALLLHGDIVRGVRLLAPLTEALQRTGALPQPPLNIELLAVVPGALWCLGYPDQALQVGQMALELVQREESRIQIGIDVLMICNAISLPSQLRGDVEGVEEALQMLRSLTEEQRCPPFWLPVIGSCQGWVHAQRGLLEQGIAEMRQGLADTNRSTTIRAPCRKGWIAEACARAGRVEEGLALVSEALEQVERTGERWNEAELWRLKGELLRLGDAGTRGHGDSGSRGLGDPIAAEEVEACFRRAITVAQSQQAKSWELRATTSLARLLRSQGRAAEAREALAAIYGWFTEGFDTPDLVEAKGLLRELEI